MNKARFEDLVNLALEWANKEKALMEGVDATDSGACLPMAVQLSECRADLYNVIKKIAADETTNLPTL